MLKILVMIRRFDSIVTCKQSIIYSYSFSSSQNPSSRPIIAIMVFDVNRALSASSHTRRSHLERMSKLIKFKHLVARMPERVDVERTGRVCVSSNMLISVSLKGLR